MRTKPEECRRFQKASDILPSTQALYFSQEENDLFIYHEQGYVSLSTGDRVQATSESLWLKEVNKGSLFVR